MSRSDESKRTLHRYLVAGRESLLWKLDGLSEYDQRRPLLPTGTNLLGLVKHVASVALGYFGDTFGRPHGEDLPWFADDAEPNADLWVGADETLDEILGLYNRAWAHADATIDELSADAIGRVPWWPEDRAEVTLHTVLVHMATEVHRHAGHADTVRELIDGSAGLRPGNDNLWVPEDGWESHHNRLEAIAQRFR
ncbi:MAG TPA: DinB family protein [Acidimicrobiia bacterium]|nr:DinB family protein [Acidimicrobiia bacterium]